MPATLGVNLRVTCHGSRGDRKYMEDFFVLNYEPSEGDHKQEYAFFGIFDGHGGKEAAVFAKDHLMNFIVNDKRFWSDDDEDVLQAITSGYLQTHYAMWQDQVNWPKTSSGLPSTSGTTASIAFIRRGKIYIGHVGDSSIVLGHQKPDTGVWVGKALTKDHKPEDAKEEARIESSGGKVVSKSGVPRVVWNRPRLGHKGPVRRSTPIDEIPFLAVARSLGDLWSYNSDKDQFIVSPHPDVHVVSIDLETHRCLIFGTDGLWNMLGADEAVYIVQSAEQHNEKNVYGLGQPATAKNHLWVNPSKSLVDRALRRWGTFGARADNTSAVTLMLDPPGAQRRSCERVLPVVESANISNMLPTEGQQGPPSVAVENLPLPNHRVAIFTRPSTSEPPASPPVAANSHVPPSNIVGPSITSSLQANGNNSLSVQESESISAVELLPQPSREELMYQANHPLPKNGVVAAAEPNSIVDVPMTNNPVERKEDDTELDIRHAQNTGDEKQDTSTAKLQCNNDLAGIDPKLATYKKEVLASCSKDEHVTNKGEHSYVKINRSQELKRLQESIQQIAESLQKHSHKRLRSKPVVSDSNLSTNHSALCPLRANASAGGSGIIRRRHSSVLDSRTGALASCFVSQTLGYSSPHGSGYQPGAKRRTRSEDKLLQAVGRLEDDFRTLNEENKKIAWPVNWINRLRPSDGGSEENKAHSCSSRRKKKWIRCNKNAIGRAKLARPSSLIRPSAAYVNGCDISRDCDSEHHSSRVLRSDTHAGMPVHTLRSQNVDLKVSRLPTCTPSKFTSKRSVQLKAALEMTSFAAGSSSLLPAAKLLLTSSGLAKRHRQTFCSRSHPVTTRSRVKRLGK